MRGEGDRGAARWPLRVGRRLGHIGLRHGLFGCLLAVAVTLRVIAVLGFPTVLWFGDSITYLQGGLDLQPSPLRPSGYSILLWLLRPLHSLMVVVSVQHALGVLMGLLVYALVQRAARSRWPDRPWLPGLIGSVAALPVLLDAYEIQLEHMLMADTLFAFLLVAAVAAAMWRDPPTWWTGALAGLLLGCAAATKSAGLPLLLVLLVCLLLRHGRWWVVPALAAAIGCAIPVGAYLSWFNAKQGVYAFTRTDQIWLYGRTAGFADCAKLKLRPEVAVLCPRTPPADPQVAPAYRALWSESVLPKIPGGMAGGAANDLAGEFAWTAIRAQPGDYASIIVRDTFRAFAWTRRPYPTPWTVAEYEFPAVPRALSPSQSDTAHAYGGRTAVPSVVEPYAGWMRGYQRWAFVPGTMLGVLLGAGLVGVIVRVRRLGGRVLLPWGVGLALLVLPAATADFDYRYVVPAVPFAALAAALACIPERGPRRRDHEQENLGPAEEVLLEPADAAEPEPEEEERPEPEQMPAKAAPAEDRSVRSSAAGDSPAAEA